MGRISMIQLRSKKLKLPCFIFSLSSYETQVRPEDGVELFQLLGPAAGLFLLTMHGNIIRKIKIFLKISTNYAIPVVHYFLTLEIMKPVGKKTIIQQKTRMAGEVITLDKWPILYLQTLHSPLTRQPQKET
jgi:hypothetical protein